MFGKDRQDRLFGVASDEVDSGLRVGHSSVSKKNLLCCMAAAAVVLPSPRMAGSVIYDIALQSPKEAWPWRFVCLSNSRLLRWLIGMVLRESRDDPAERPASIGCLAKITRLASLRRRRSDAWYLGAFWYDDRELMSSLPSESWGSLGRDAILPIEKNDRDFVEYDAVRSNGPEL